MQQDLILKFMDGQESAAALVRPFDPSEEKIDVILAKSGKRSTVPLSKICCVLNMGKPTRIHSSLGEQKNTEVETSTGERYPVQIIDDDLHPTGFFAIPTESHSPYRGIFFTRQGLRAPSGNNSLPNNLKVPKPKDPVVTPLPAPRKAPPARAKRPLKPAPETVPKPPNARLGDILIDAGLINREQIENALAAQATSKKKIGTLLIEQGLIDEVQLLSALAAKFRLRVVDLDTVVPDPAALGAFSKEVIIKLQVFPVEARGRNLVVATSAPTDPTISDALSFLTDRSIELVVAPSQQIKTAIFKHYEKVEDQVEDIIGEMTEEVEVLEEEQDESYFTEADSRVIRLVNRILLDGHKKGVSDIHFEPGQGKHPLQVRFRLDGVCFCAHQISATYKRAVVARIKILAQLDIAEHRRPQSGKIFLRTEGRNVEYRVEITPTAGGQEDAVLRILSSATTLPLEQMGFSPSDLRRFKNTLLKPYGVILCVGPTGSGKTTTLHSGLAYINTPERKIWTAEDPVEITQSGLRQVQVHPKIGLTFQEALRSFLRSDPDVIMIGEMRDPETAKTAIEASLTGHLVLSTLHTNSAPETVVRLIEIGIDPFNFADAVLGILAQRLARKLCEKCKAPYHPSREDYDKLLHAYGREWAEKHQLPAYSDDLSLMQPVGCEECSGSGYRGRAPLFELLEGTANIKKAIQKNCPVEEIKTIAIQEGMRTLKMDGIHKVFEGVTDLVQVLKVCV
ncbi:MAG: type II secretion system protein E [Desulfuromonas sp.]|uniref:GspE/PulE family protein n=1 Tax=Desulfuromonas sp. TaxID=892 RepID=UPI000CC97274|nr:ATPase, T2SS/T4P/T4SS family [Desulfuromonas sp.]PLX83117.1 MAG: type II secretion system protein E [Desulfuromonas sp.]